MVLKQLKRIIAAQQNDLYFQGNRLRAIPNEIGGLNELRALMLIDNEIKGEIPVALSKLTNLAFLYEEMGRFEEAEVFHRRALEILEKLGPDQPDLAQSLNGLAIVYDRQGKHAEALPLYTRALEISEKVLEPEHPGIATTVMNLASLHVHMGEQQQASLASAMGKLPQTIRN